MSIVLDAGALIGVDRGTPNVVRKLELLRRSGEYLRTSAPVVAQVWRHGTRQARLAQFLDYVDVRPVDDTSARAAGRLLAISGTSDVVDALVTLVAQHGDRIVTSDPDDLRQTAAALGYPVTIVAV